MRYAPLLLALLTVAPCDGGGAIPDSGAPAVDAGSSPAPLAEGVHVLRGEADLQTESMVGTTLRSESMLLYVDAAGLPTHVRDTRFDETFALVFSGPGSNDVCLRDGCDLVVERASGCAVWTYTEYFRPLPGDDAGDILTGTVRACPTGETRDFEASLAGVLEPSTLLPDGAARIEASYPLDPAVDTFEIAVDGVVVPSEWTFGDDLSRGELVLPQLAIGADVQIRHTGSRTVTLTGASTFSTTNVVSDLSFDTAPPAGAIDARGQALVPMGGALVLDDEGRWPRVPFVVTVALDEPPAGSVGLDLTVETGERFTGLPEAWLVRADGTEGPRALLRDGALDLPAGAGPVWLVIGGDQDLAGPSDMADPRVFTLDAVAWR